MDEAGDPVNGIILPVALPYSNTIKGTTKLSNLKPGTTYTAHIVPTEGPGDFEPPCISPTSDIPVDLFPRNSVRTTFTTLPATKDDTSNRTIKKAAVDEVTVIPNPASHWVEVKWKEEGYSDLFVYSSQGSILYHAPIAQKQLTLNIQLDEIPSGIYYIKLIHKDGIVAYEPLVITKDKD